MRIIWAKSAREDLNSIECYIAEDDPLAALRTIIKIINKTETLLVKNQVIGRAGRILGTRELIISGTPYIVPYKISEKYIEVLRVLHNARKWPDKL